MTELRPFQLEGVRAIYRFRGRALLADDMGLGKTIQALSWIERIPQHRPVVIVAPASVKYIWQAEAALHFGRRIEVLEGNRPQRVMSLPGPIVVVNYDILRSWLPCLLKHQPSVLILDEIQYCKNHLAARTRAATRLSAQAESVVGLSGTPLTNRPIELWSVMRIVRPDLFPDRIVYAWTYCQPRKTIWGWKFDGAANLGRLHRILRSECMIRRRKQDVLPELPRKQRAVVPFRLSKRAMEEYQKAEDDFLSWLRAKNPARANRAKKSPALVKVGYLMRLVAKLKEDATRRWIHEFFECHPSQKLVAFTMHRAVIDALRETFSRSVVIDGRVTGRKRTDSVRTFQSNRRVQLALCNWRAGSVGITLTASSHAVSLDFPWTPGDLLQGEDRIHRIGQKSGSVLIHYLVALDTIEEKLMRILQRKARTLDAVLDGSGSISQLSIFDELLMEMERK